MAALLAAAVATGTACARMPHIGTAGEGATASVSAPEPEPSFDLADATVTVEDQTYTGLALTPEPTVVLEGKTLAVGTDYTLAYKDNVKPGTARVMLTAQGDYEGDAEATFTIAPHPRGWDNLEGYLLYYKADSSIARNSFVPGTDGTWFYVGKYGTPVTNAWVSAGGSAYYIGNDGRPLTNAWVNTAGKRFYVGEDGHPVTGLQTIDGEAYIFNGDGSLRYISNSERLDRIVCGLIRDVVGFDTREAYDYVAQSFTYVRQPIDTDFADWEETYALDLVDTGEGNCYNYSALYNFLLRAMGYKSKTIDGICSNRNTGKYYHHSWVEVYMDDGTYVCDPVLECYGSAHVPSYFITYAENEVATTWLVYELDWDGYPALSPQYP